MSTAHVASTSSASPTATPGRKTDPVSKEEGGGRKIEQDSRHPLRLRTSTSTHMGIHIRGAHIHSK